MVKGRDPLSTRANDAGTAAYAKRRAQLISHNRPLSALLDAVLPPRVATEHPTESQPEHTSHTTGSLSFEATRPRGGTGGYLSTGLHQRSTVSLCLGTP